MEKKSCLKDETFLHHPYIVIVAFGTWVCENVEPLEMGPVEGHEFKPVKYDIAPYKQVMERWLRDNHSRLLGSSLNHWNLLNRIFNSPALFTDSIVR
ncbi:hypothetical protein ACOSQ2_006461 [Xanthoceras sorbifolium]